MRNDDIIGMAWADRISFEEIKKKTSFSEKEVIKLMRKNLKKKSYILCKVKLQKRRLLVLKKAKKEQSK